MKKNELYLFVVCVFVLWVAMLFSLARNLDLCYGHDVVGLKACVIFFLLFLSFFFISCEYKILA